MSEVKLKIESSISDCDGCYFNKGRNGCVADGERLDSCIERFECGDNTIYKLEIEA